MSQLSLATRIEAGVREAGVDVNASQIQQMIQYLAHLDRWNRAINLTALPLSGHSSATLERLIFEPVRSRALFDSGPLRWLDLGSGGGSPAIPLRILLPEAGLTMVESRSRKAAFLRDVVRVLSLSDVQVLWQRVETLDREVAAASVDVVTIRALRIDEGVSRVIRHVLDVSGRVVLFGVAASTGLLPDFEPIARPSPGKDIHVLRRRRPLFHVEQ